MEHTYIKAASAFAMGLQSTSASTSLDAKANVLLQTATTGAVALSDVRFWWLCVWLCVCGWCCVWVALCGCGSQLGVFTHLYTHKALTLLSLLACFALLATTDHGRHNEHCWQDCVCAQRIQLCSHRHVCMCSCFRLHLCVQWLCMAEAARSYLLRLYITLQQSARYEGRTHTRTLHLYTCFQTSTTTTTNKLHASRGVHASQLDQKKWCEEMDSSIVLERTTGICGCD